MLENGRSVSLAGKIYSQPTDRDLYLKPYAVSVGSHYRLTLRGTAHDGAIFQRVFDFIVNKAPENGMNQASCDRRLIMQKFSRSAHYVYVYSKSSNKSMGDLFVKVNFWVVYLREQLFREGRLISTFGIFLKD